MDSKNTGVTVAQSDRACMPFDLTFDNVKGKYQLKRKAVDEHEAVSKRLRVTAEIFALLETEDLSAKLEIKNNLLMKGMKSMQEIITDETSTTLGTKLEAWCKEIIESMRQNYCEASREYELRKQLSKLLDEYKSNKELMEESRSDATWCSNKWDGPISTLMTCNNDLQIRVLGMQKLREMVDEKRADLISKVVKLDKEMKNLGVAFI